MTLVDIHHPIKSSLSSENLRPFLEKFFLFVGEKNQHNFSFRCELCKPAVKFFSTSKQSQNSLKTHMSQMHHHKLNEYQELLNQSKKGNDLVKIHLLVITRKENFLNNPGSLRQPVRPSKLFLKKK